MWTPIISSPAVKERAWQVVDDIANHLANVDSRIAPAHDVSAAEAALLFGYLSLYHRTETRWLETTETFLNDAIGRADQIRRLALYGGLCGLAWILEHLASMVATQGGADERRPGMTIYARTLL
jgi:hypothetical protein